MTYFPSATSCRASPDVDFRISEQRRFLPSGGGPLEGCIDSSRTSAVLRDARRRRQDGSTSI